MKQVEVSWLDCGCVASRRISTFKTMATFRQRGGPLDVVSVTFGLEQIHTTMCPFAPKSKRGKVKPVSCAHCGRVCGDSEGGWGSLNGEPLCQPSVDGRPDCYRLVTVYHHPLDHQDCAVTDGVLGADVDNDAEAIFSSFFAPAVESTLESHDL